MVIYLRRAGAADIERLIADPTGFEDFVFEEAVYGVDVIDFDKAWDAVHFMLIDGGRTPHPLGLICEALPELGADENGFDGFGVISPDRMAAFAAALDKLDDATLAGRYDPAAMVAADIYLADMFAGEGAEALDYIMQGVPALRRFATTCRRTGDGAIRVIA